GTSISAEAFWSGFADLLREFGPSNRELLQLRNELQSRIDQYHRERSGEPLDVGDYERFLHDIGYLLKVTMSLSAQPMSMTLYGTDAIPEADKSAVISGCPLCAAPDSCSAAKSLPQRE